MVIEPSTFVLFAHPCLNPRIGVTKGFGRLLQGRVDYGRSKITPKTRSEVVTDDGFAPFVFQEIHSAMKRLEDLQRLRLADVSQNSAAAAITDILKLY